MSKHRIAYEQIANRLHAATGGFKSVEIFETLAKDPQSQVRHAVVENLETPAAVLYVLAKDTDRMIRLKVLAHPNLNEHTAVFLAFDHDDEISAAAVDSHVLSTDIHDRLRSVLNSRDLIAV